MGLPQPYGEIRWNNGTNVTDFGFTSQRNDGYIKLIDYGARWYDPVLGRFISPDTIIPDPANGQSFNRYTYVYNNPLKYTDPSGHCSEEAGARRYAECQDIAGKIASDMGDEMSLDQALEYNWGREPVALDGDSLAGGGDSSFGYQPYDEDVVLYHDYNDKGYDRIYEVWSTSKDNTTINTLVEESSGDFANFIEEVQIYEGARGANLSNIFGGIPKHGTSVMANILDFDPEKIVVSFLNLVSDVADIGQTVYDSYQNTEAMSASKQDGYRQMGQMGTVGPLEDIESSYR